MLKIRLARVGKKKKPAYRLIVNESARDTYGRALEILGHHNPFTKVTEVKKDRILYWISKGAQLSPTVHNLLVDQNVIDKDKVVASKSKKKKGAEEEKPAEAPKPAEGEAAPEATETPAEEVKSEEAAPAAPAEEAPKEDPKVEEKPEEKKEEAAPAAEEAKEEPKA